MAQRRIVAVMIDLQWPYKYHQEVFVGVQRFARQAGDWNCQIDLHAADALAKQPTRYDGIVGRITKPVARGAGRRGVPVVNCWLNSPVTATTPSVVQDQRLAGAMAAEHLLARGLRTFGYVGYRGDRNAMDQWDGFSARLAQAACPPSRLLIHRNYSETGKGWARFQADLEAWIATWRRPIGIFAAHDLMCRYLAETLRRLDWKVPQDAALIAGFNEPMIAASGDPTLTGIEWGFERLGYKAAELLDRLMNGAAPPGEPQLHPPVDIAARRSTDLMAVDDPVVAAALRFISEQSHHPIHVDDVAVAVASTRRSLERRFREVLDRSIAAEITRLRLERVKRLLIETDLPIQTLATQSGFGGPIQMCKVFRRHEKISPGEFRRRRR